MYLGYHLNSLRAYWSRALPTRRTRGWRVIRRSIPRRRDQHIIFMCGMVESIQGLTSITNQSHEKVAVVRYGYLTVCHRRSLFAELCQDKYGIGGNIHSAFYHFCGIDNNGDSFHQEELLSAKASNNRDYSPVVKFNMPFGGINIQHCRE